MADLHVDVELLKGELQKAKLIIARELELDHVDLEALSKQEGSSLRRRITELEEELGYIILQYIVERSMIALRVVASQKWFIHKTVCMMRSNSYMMKNVKLLASTI